MRTLNAKRSESLLQQYFPFFMACVLNSKIFFIYNFDFWGIVSNCKLLLKRGWRILIRRKAIMCTTLKNKSLKVKLCSTQYVAHISTEAKRDEI